ncbi:MAG: hypothetical protein HY304_03460 [candidate division Zixibacteria bacterium]|nr:hypothetical protein [candidate division Zixibacteria bacterium]
MSLDPGLRRRLYLLRLLIVLPVLVAGGFAYWSYNLFPTPSGASGVWGEWRLFTLLLLIGLVAAGAGVVMSLVNRVVRALEDREADLSTSQQQLITADRLASVGMMAASVAHEVNNPLTTIKVLIHTVHEKLPKTDPRRADLDIVLTEIDKIKVLILRLLQFARPREPEFSAVDLNSILSRVVDLIRPQAQAQKLSVRERYTPLSPLRADGPLLGQAILNILLNALDATPAGGTIRVSTDGGSDGLIHATIHNTGDGLAAGLEERVFDPFFTTKAAGTGLGLSIGRMIVDKHAGTIRAVGHGANGTSFEISLPSQPGDTGDAAHPHR